MRTNLFLIFLITTAFLTNAQVEYTKLYDFDSINGFNQKTVPSVVDDTYLYGTNIRGGAHNFGVIYRIKKDGTEYEKLLDFDGENGKDSYGGLVTDGVYLYGATYVGGENDNGLIYKLKKDGTDFQKLHEFEGGINGGGVFCTMMIEGNYLYGTTVVGGTEDKGLLFKIKTNGEEYTELFEFTEETGFFAGTPLITDGTYLYSKTSAGGNSGRGVIYKVKLDGTDYTVLYDIPSTSQQGSNGFLLEDDSYLYGATHGGGGADGIGNIFKMKVDGSEYQNLLNFGTTENEFFYITNFIKHEGYLYALGRKGGVFNEATSVFFKIKPDGSDYTELYDFDGEHLRVLGIGLVDDDNYFYGATGNGGVNNKGIIFKIKKDSELGLDKLNSQNQIKVYPNPAYSTLNINVDKSQTVYIVDVLGSKMLQKELNYGNNIIDVSNLSKGIYFIQNDYNTVIKFIKE